MALLALAGLVALGVAVHGHSRPGPFDRSVDGWFTGHVSGRLALWFADLGNGPVVAVLALLAVFACLRWVTVFPARAAALVVLAPALAVALTEWVVKPLVHRTFDGDLAYPSGHIAGFGALALAVAVAARRRWLAVVAILLAVLCGLGLVASDYHYATDVIGGACLAIACVFALSAALRVPAG